MASGKTTPMSPLVSTLRAHAAAKPQAVAREGRLLERDPEQQHGEAEPEANDHVRNKDAGVDEDAERSEQDQRRVEAGHVGSK